MCLSNSLAAAGADKSVKTDGAVTLSSAETKTNTSSSKYSYSPSTVINHIGFSGPVAFHGCSVHFSPDKSTKTDGTMAASSAETKASANSFTHGHDPTKVVNRIRFAGSVTFHGCRVHSSSSGAGKAPGRIDEGRIVKPGDGLTERQAWAQNYYSRSGGEASR